MDIEKLIEAVRLCGSTPKVDQCKQCAYWSGGDMSKCIPRMTTAAATSLSTLQAENAQLRAELENYRKGHCSEGGCAAEKDRDAVLAELEQAKAERDAAIEDIDSILAKAESIRRKIGYCLDYDSDDELASLCGDYCKNNGCKMCYEEREDGGCGNFLWRSQKEG